MTSNDPNAGIIIPQFGLLNLEKRDSREYFHEKVFEIVVFVAKKSPFVNRGEQSNVRKITKTSQ